MRGEQAGCDSELGSGVVVASAALPGEREDLMNLNRKALQKLCHRPVAEFNELLD